jgi:hypothetical protein
MPMAPAGAASAQQPPPPHLTIGDLGKEPGSQGGGAQRVLQRFDQRPLPFRLLADVLHGGRRGGKVGVMGRKVRADDANVHAPPTVSFPAPARVWLAAAPDSPGTATRPGSSPGSSPGAQSG